MVPTPPPTYTLPLPAALPISLTSNQRCERRHRLRLDAGARFDRLPDSKWLGLAFRLYGVGVLVVDHGLRRPIRRLADDHSVYGRSGLKPGGRVDDVARSHALPGLWPCIEIDQRLAR